MNSLSLSLVKNRKNPSCFFVKINELISSEQITNDKLDIVICVVLLLILRIVCVIELLELELHYLTIIVRCLDGARSIYSLLFLFLFHSLFSTFSLSLFSLLLWIEVSKVIRSQISVLL